MLITKDHFVPHVSTVPANAGQLVGLHVREKVRARARGAARVVLFAPSPTIPGLKVPDRPGAGFPVSLQTREDLEQVRWDPDVRCPGQLEPGIRDVLWKAIMRWDRVGAGWGPAEGVMRGRAATRFGWPPELAARVKAPTLVMVGEYDRLQERYQVFRQIGSRDKVFLELTCASHFALWERQHAVLHRASKEWLTHGRLKGLRRGELLAAPGGRLRIGRDAARKNPA